LSGLKIKIPDFFPEAIMIFNPFEPISALLRSEVFQHPERAAAEAKEEKKVLDLFAGFRLYDEVPEKAPEERLADLAEVRLEIEWDDKRAGLH
jgi:hypothetical protein